MQSLSAHFVYPPNTAIMELATAELFTISSSRLWIARFKDPAAAVPDWREGFMAAGLQGEAESAFEALFRIVATTARRALDFRCRCCRALGGDEALLLRAVSLLQNARLADAREIFDDWLPRAAARLAMHPAGTYAEAMSRVALRVPLRHAHAAQMERLAPPSFSDPGLELLQ